MRRFFPALLSCVLVALILAACDVPTPPPELPTPTPGSSNPENDLSRSQLTPVLPTPERGFTPIATSPGHIYFVRDGHLWTVAPDGAGAHQLSDLPITGKPEPSPDGSMVAWVADKDLYLMPSGGGTAQKLYSGDLTDGQRIGWSPDNKYLGFFTYDLTSVGTENAWYLPVSGGTPSLITTFTGSNGGYGASYERSVKWSPDDHWLAVGAVDNPGRLMRWPLSADQSANSIDIAGGEPDWSPDSRTLLYTETLDGAVLIYGIRDNGATPFRNEKLLVGTGLGEYAQGPGPLWSPASIGGDSDLLVYRTRSLSGEPSIAVRDRAGQDFASLPANTNNASWAPSGDRLVVETGVVKKADLGLQWSPTGIATAVISFTGPQTLVPLQQDAQWPAWGK